MDPFNTDNEQRSHLELEAAIESLNRTPSDDQRDSQAAAGPVVNVISKIEWLETELMQQKKNFQNVDRRFDDLSNQIAALSNAIVSAGENSSPIAAADSVAAEQRDATDMDCTHSPEVVSEETGKDPHQNINNSCESVVLSKTESDDDVTDQLLAVRTRGAASIDSLLAKLNAVDSENECDADAVPQPDASRELESIPPETNSTDNAIDQQKRQLEELFASLRNRDAESPVEDSLPANEADATLSDNQLESEQPQEPQSSPAGSESAAFDQEPATEHSACLQSSPELDEAATFDPEIQVPELDVALQESVAAEVAFTVPEATVKTSVASLLAEHVDGTDVQDYMNSLLQRLKGGEPAKPPTSTTVVNVVAPAGTITEAPVNPDVISEVERLQPDEFLPKRVAPEKNANMSAMRQLANASSRSAVKSSERRRQKANSNLHLLLAGGGIAGAAFSSAMSQSRGDLLFYLSICLLVVSLACICCYARAQIFVQHEDAGDNVVEPLVSESAGFDWSRLNEFTNLISSKLNRSPKESS